MRRFPERVTGVARGQNSEGLRRIIRLFLAVLLFRLLALEFLKHPVHFIEKAKTEVE